jgi:hypothetical protein
LARDVLKVFPLLEDYEFENDNVEFVVERAELPEP